MTTDDAGLDARHVNLDNLNRLWVEGLPVRVPIAGSPVCRLQVDPGHDEISLQVPLDGPEPDVARYRNIEVYAFVEDDVDWAEVRIKVNGALHGAYAILASIADRVQIEHEQLSVAVPRAVAQHRGVFAGRAAPSTELEIGLFGELLAVESLINDFGAEAALMAWVGPLSEEHDLVFADCHIEVKTTVRERRQHLIGDVQQLEPLRGIPLWLLSIQVTRSVLGAGRTLSELVADIRQASGAHRAELDARLDAVGWDDEAAGLFQTVWALRSAPRAYPVDDRFPSMTQARLTAVVPQPELLSEVSYRVDVTDMPHDRAPAELTSFVETSEHRYE